MYAKGNVAKLDIQVSNSGGRNADDFQIDLYQEANLIETIPAGQPLEAGQTRTLSVTHRLEQGNVEQNLRIEVTPVSTDADTDPSDNTATITLGSRDAEVKSAYFTSEGGVDYLNVTVKNAGSVTLENIRLTGGAMDANSSAVPPSQLVIDKSIDKLYPGEEILCRAVVGSEDSANSKYEVSVSAAGDGNSYNDSFLTLRYSQSDKAFAVTDVGQKEGTPDIQAEVRVKPGDTEKTVLLVTALYRTDDSGNQELAETELTRWTVSASAEETALLTITAPAAGRYTFKLFVLESGKSFAPVQEAYSRSLVVR